MTFKNKRVTQADNLGDKLKEARTDLGVSLKRVGKDLDIAPKYLEAMENNQLAVLPGAPYLKNFLRLYCKYLHLDFDDYWSLIKNNNYSDESPKVEKKYLQSWPKLIRGSLGMLVAVAILIFLIIKIERIFAPPNLEIIQPQDGLITEDRRLEVVGRSEKEVEIVINNENVLVDSDGGFQASIDLQKGYNLIKITASKRYGRSQNEEIKVLFKDK